MKILVADDYKKSREQLEEILKELGHEVIAAVNGKDALDLYMDNKIEVAFIDWSMPEMNGIELCKEIQINNSLIEHESYIILVTAKSKKRDMVEGLEAGADDFVLKPYEKGIIASRIDVAKRVLETKKTKFQAKPPALIKPLEILTEEHELIHRMTGVLEVVANMLDDEVPLPKKLLEWCSSSVFLLNFKLHEQKEDYYIRIFIERAKEVHGQTSKMFTRSSVSQIIREHILIEKLLKNMQAKVMAYEVGRKKEVKALKESINRYLPLIRLHAAREDDVFFPFTERYFNDDDIDQLVKDFAMVEEKIGTEKIKARLETIQQLEVILKIKE